MNLVEKEGYYKLEVVKEEITYNLEMILKATTTLDINSVKRISSKTTDLLFEIGQPYIPLRTKDLDRASFYQETKAYWAKVCKIQIEHEKLCKDYL